MAAAQLLVLLLVTCIAGSKTLIKQETRWVLGARGAGPPPQFFTHVYFVNIALLFALHYYLNPLVAEDSSGATVCTIQWNKIQSCYTLVLHKT